MKEILDNVRLLAFAGHETTASVMAWMAFHLAEDPAVWARVAEEAAGKPLPTTPRDLASFPVTEAVFREALRLNPPLPIDSRTLTGAMEAHGEALPIGAVGSVCIAELSRDPEVYERPDAFWPDRWLGARKRPTPLETCQFGAGPHFCLGYHLAWLEMVQFGVALAHRIGLGHRPTTPNGMPRPRSFPLMRPPYGVPLHLGPSPQ